MMTTEAHLLTQVSSTQLWQTTSTLAQWERHSGTASERMAFDYVQQTLNDYGLRTTLLEHPALVSYPLDATLAVLDAQGNPVQTIACLGTAYSASVEDLAAEVVDVGYGTPTEYASADVTGKIVLINGLATPPAVYAAEQAGAIGQIFINDDHLHYMIVSTIWGTPTPESAARIPATPSVSVVEADGHALRALIAQGPVQVRLTTQVFMDWQQTPILVAELDGAQRDEFVMFSGHLDAWEVGAMDNGAANATMMEVGRLLAQHKDELYRGLRLIFWSGHSHGRYSGSTWYVDNHWEELYDRCVAHVNVDSTGAQGATSYGAFPAHLELAPFGSAIIQEQTGQHAQANRMSRAGDMSFNGVGIPALFMTLSAVPFDPAQTNYVTEAAGKLLGATMPWFWHTREDTIDKIDLDVLVLDTKVYVSTLWRLCHDPLLPMDFRPVVADLETTLTTLQQQVGERLDFSVALARTAQLAQVAATLAEECRKVDPADLSAIGALNQQMKVLSRLLIPITYTAAGRFEHDPAWAMGHLPSLQQAAALVRLDPTSDEYHFLRTKLVRNLNAVNWALRQAVAGAA
ncbi:MAG: M28 family peptidase [Caldilineaceae bacterium]